MEYGFDSLFGEGPTPTASGLGLTKDDMEGPDELNTLEDIDGMSVMTTNSNVDGMNIWWNSNNYYYY